MSEKSYDRQPKESIRAYEAFCVYRDMGKARSLDNAYCIYRGIAEGSKRAKSFFRAWSVEFRWVDRCKDYEDDQEKIRREELQSKNSAEYNAKIEKYRKQTETMGMNTIQVAINVMVTFSIIANKLHEKIEAGEQALTREEVSQLNILPGAIQRLVSAAESGARLAGDAYYLNDMLSRVEDKADV